VKEVLTLLVADTACLLFWLVMF